MGDTMPPEDPEVEAILEETHAAAVARIMAAMGAGFEPPPRQTVSEWADARRILTRRESNEPGPWRTDRTPYLREIMDCLSVESPIEEVVFQKGAQIGGSEVGNNWLGYILDHPPAAAPTMVIYPTVDLARGFSRQRLEPLIKSIPGVVDTVAPKRSRDGGNTILSKEFANGDGILKAVGANSAAGLRSMPARWIYPDEIDAFPLDVEGEGDPLALVAARSSTFGTKAKRYTPSTPTIKGESRIEALFADTDQRRYFIPCTACRHTDWIRWERIHWTDDEPRTAALVCLECGALMEESAKPWLLANGVWTPTATCPPHVRGYHLSGLYSPLGWKSWERCVREFLKAKRQADRIQLLKTWTNTVLGETWEERGEGVNPKALLARREHYAAPVPEAAVVLTAGVDVQDNRLEVLVKGWARGEESWDIAADKLLGDPHGPAVWRHLDEYLAQSWEHELGAQLRVMATCVDSSWATSDVYRYVQHRQTARIYATKGRAGEGYPITSNPSRKKLGQAHSGWVDLYTIGVDTAKGLVYARLRLTDPGPGYIHTPATPDFDEEWMAQVCAEKRTTTFYKGHAKRAWVNTRARNEALDLQVLNLAALYLLNPVWGVLERAMAKRAPEKKPDPAPTHRRRSSWVNRWKD